MAGIIFSQNSGLNDDLFKDTAIQVRSLMYDADKENNKYDSYVNAVFNVETSDRFGEKQSSLTEFGDFEIVPEGGNAIQDELQQGFNKLIIHEQMLKKFTVTASMVEDNQIADLKKKAFDFVYSYKRSRAREASTLLTGATATSVKWGGKMLDTTTGDGKALFATDHPGIKTGVAVQSNVFTNAFGNDDQMLYKLASIGRNFKNQSGEVMGFDFDTLIIPGNASDIQRIAEKIIGSDQQVGSNYNDVNVSKGRWKLVVDPLWNVDTSQKIPYMIMSSEANKKFGGNMFYDRLKLSVREWIDDNNWDLNYSGRYRAGVGFNIWQHIILGGASAGTSL